MSRLTGEYGGRTWRSFAELAIAQAALSGDPEDIRQAYGWAITASHTAAGRGMVRKAAIALGHNGESEAPESARRLQTVDPVPERFNRYRTAAANLGFQIVVWRSFWPDDYTAFFERKAEQEKQRHTPLRASGETISTNWLANYHYARHTVLLELIDLQEEAGRFPDFWQEYSQLSLAASNKPAA